MVPGWCWFVPVQASCVRPCSRQRARALLLTAVALTFLPASAAGGPTAPLDAAPARPSRIADDQFLPAPVELQVEMLPVPVLGLSERAPRFSWVAEVPPGTRGLAQTAYRVRVARATEPKVTTWDSGQVSSTVSYGIEYAGAPLEPNTAYTWTTEWWGSNGGRSSQSVGEFDTGPFDEGDWHGAKWLAALNNTISNDRSQERAQFRAEFTLPEGAVSWARAHVAAPGCHHFEINGHVPSLDRMGVCVFREPNKTVLWQTHNITELVQPGPNAVGLLAGHVLQSHPAYSKATPIVRALIVVCLDDNKTVVLVTDPEIWRSRSSYVARDSLYTGTTMNWTQVDAGWSSPGFQPSTAWAVPPTVSPPEAPLRREGVPPTAALGVVKPVAVQRLDNGGFLYSFPSNFVGVVRVSPLPSASNGTTLTITHGEYLGAGGGAANWPPTPAHIPDKHFISADGLGLWFMAGGERHHVTSTTECGVNLFDPRPWGFRLTDAQIKGIAKSSTDFDCTMCNSSCFATNKPIVDPSAVTLMNTFNQVDTHVLRHGNTAPLTPLFTWHGFQYITIEASGFDFAGGIDAIDALELRTNLTQRGLVHFGGDQVEGSVSEHDAALLNAIVNMTLNSQKSNVAQGMPTDCPTRERKGWLGDALDASDEALYNFDMGAVYENFVSQMSDDQGKNGNIPIYVPNDGQCKGVGGNNCSGCPLPYNPNFDTGCSDIGWTLAFPAIVEAVYNYTGDTRLMKTQYNNLKRYTDNLVAVAQTRPHLVADCDRWGDWVPPTTCNLNDGRACPVFSLIAGFSYVRGLDIMSRVANALDYTSEGDHYRVLADTARAGYHARFFDESISAYGSNASQLSFQTLNIPGLVIDAPPAAIRPAIVAGLAHDLQNRTDYHLGTGAVTSKYLLNILSENGLHNAAVRVATQESAPSWGFWRANNATTCWESWGTGDSHNHIFLCGGVSEWMWAHLVGITPVSPGFGHVLVEPKVDCALGPSSARASLRTPHGKLFVAWERTSGKTALNVTVPLGTTSTVIVPKPCSASGGGVQAVSYMLRESGHLVQTPRRESETRRANAADELSVVVASGSYSFVVEETVN